MTSYVYVWSCVSLYSSEDYNDQAFVSQHGHDP